MGSGPSCSQAWSVKTQPTVRCPGRGRGEERRLESLLRSIATRGGACEASPRWSRAFPPSQAWVPRNVADHWSNPRDRRAATRNKEY